MLIALLHLERTLCNDACSSCETAQGSGVFTMTVNTCPVGIGAAHQKGMSWPSQAMKRPVSAMLTPSMMPSSCFTARSLVNSFSGITFCVAGSHCQVRQPAQSNKSHAWQVSQW